MHKDNEQLVAPKVSEGYQLQYSVHRIRSRSLREEIWRVFPDAKPPRSEYKDKDLFIIPTFQQCQFDLVAAGDGPDAEKDRLLQNFFAWAKLVARKLKDRGYWADFADPSSGNPVLTSRGGSTFNDLDVLSQLLPYGISQVGNCHVCTHPQWGTAVYPATFVTTAPLDVLSAALLAAHQQPHTLAGHCPCCT